MNYNNSTESYMRSIAKVGIRQYSRPRDLFDLSSWLALWKPIGKVLLIIFPLVVVVNVFLASVVSDIDRSIVNMDNQRHELVDRHMELLASKARLWSPASMQRLAGKKLALHIPSDDQVGRFNRRTGTFIYP
jgi:hypothetical protein